MGTVKYLSLPRASKGMSLLITLIMLLVITISALGMMQMLNSGVTTSGNIAFRQAAVRVSDLAVEAGRTWLLGQSEAYRLNDNPTNGYYANYQPNFNPAVYDFTDPAKARSLVDPNSGYIVYYVIHRMALNSGLACSSPGAGCMFPPAVSSAGTTQGNSQSGGQGYVGNIAGTTGLVYYRMTIKVSGPRQNNRFVQVFFY